MHKKTAVVAFGAGWLAGNFSFAVMATYRLLKAMERAGMDISSVDNVFAEIKTMTVSIRFYQELLTYVQEHNPEILEDERFEQFRHDFEFIRITKDI